MTEIAFVLGNGITRLEVDHNSLLKHGKTYGCNRIYQEYTPSVLVSVDQSMSHEIQNSGYSKKYPHYTRLEHTISLSGAKVLPEHLHSMSSGPAAVGLALESSAGVVYMIGFDLKGHNNLINNIYAGTEHYKPKSSVPTSWTNWENQIIRLCNQYPSKKVVQVNPLGNFTSDKWLKLANFGIIQIDEFKLMINNL